MALVSYEQYGILIESSLRIFPFFSIIGSSIIIYMIIMEYRHRRSKLARPTYTHLMFVISAIDIVTSFSMMLGKLMVPKSGYEDGYGNRATCTFQGWIITIGVGTIACYNACLMIYFVLAVRCGITERVISKKYEPMMHVIFLVVVLAWTVPGFVWQVFNPKILMMNKNTTILSEQYEHWILNSNVTNKDMGIIIPYCNINAYPNLCDDTTINLANSSTIGDVGIECERGTNEGLYFASCVAFVGVCCIIILASLLLLYLKIRSQEISNQRFQFGRSAAATTRLARKRRLFRFGSGGTNASASSAQQGAPSTAVAPASTTNVINTGAQQAHSRRRKLSNRVAMQAILYGIFFFNAYLWIGLGGYLKNDLVAELLAVVFNFSQGVLNCCVYMKPYIERFRRERTRIRQRRIRLQQPRQRGCNTGAGTCKDSPIDILQMIPIQNNESIFETLRKSLQQCDYDGIFDNENGVRNSDIVDAATDGGHGYEDASVSNGDNWGKHNDENIIDSDIDHGIDDVILNGDTIDM